MRASGRPSPDGLRSHLLGRRDSEEPEADPERRLRPLDEADPAGPGDRQTGVPAEVRDLLAARERGLQDRRPRRGVDLLTVERQLRHG